MVIPDPPAAAPKPSPPLLLTSFQPWLPHQRSNASDDLLRALQDLTTRRALGGVGPGDRPLGLGHCILLRNLPVSFEGAPAAVRRAIAHYNPRAIVACGMAEGRSHLTLEQYGRRGDRVFATPFPVHDLCQGLKFTKPSEDAGTFVCNALYADLLAARPQDLTPPSLFVHVPPLTVANRGAILADFYTILERLIAHLHKNQTPAPPATTESRPSGSSTLNF